MFNVQSLKGLSVFLVMLIIFTGVSSNFISAQGLTEVSYNPKIVTFAVRASLDTFNVASIFNGIYAIKWAIHRFVRNSV